MTTELARVPVQHSEKRRRTEQVAVRFTPDEMAGVRALAAAHGMTVPELLRIAVLCVQVDEARHG